MFENDVEGWFVTFVPLVFGDLLGDVLDLKEQLDPLYGGDGGLGDGRGDASSEEVLQEGYGVGESSRRHLDRVCWALQATVCTDRAPDCK